MKLITAFIVSLIMSGSVFARNDLDRVVSAKAFKEPVIHEMVINDDPALSRSNSPGIITTQVIDWGGQCIFGYQDIDVTFGIPTIPSYSMVSADVKLDYADANFYDESVWFEPEIDYYLQGPEVDIVGFGDSALSVGVLKGKAGEANTASWKVLNQIRYDSASDGLGFQINIDAIHHDETWWCLVVNTATLTTRWE